MELTQQGSETRATPFDRETVQKVQTALLQHKGVDASVLIQRKDSQSNWQLIAYIVPNQQTAHPVRQFAQLEHTGKLEGKQTYTLPNHMLVFHHTNYETEDSYTEIFTQEQECWRDYISLPDHAIILDIGANIGMFSLYANSICKHPTIFAFEPIPSSFELLQLNVALYGVNAKLFQCGLADTSEMATFTYYPLMTMMSSIDADMAEDREIIKNVLFQDHLDEGESASISAEDLDNIATAALTSEQITCQMKTLSECIREEDLTSIDLVKMDVEKSELAVLKGIAEEDWAKIRQLIVEVHDFQNTGGLRQEIEELLQSHGYTTVLTERENNGYACIYAFPSNRTATDRIDEAEHSSENEATVQWNNPRQLIDDITHCIQQTCLPIDSPSHFVLLPSLPRDSAGSIDENRLPLPTSVQWS